MDKYVKLPSGAHAVVLTEPDENGKVVVLVSGSARKVEIEASKLKKR